MIKKQKDNLLKMQEELGLIKLLDVESENLTDLSGKIVYIDDKKYVLVDDMTDEEKKEYLKIQKAYNLLQIKKGVNFFVWLAVIAIFLSVIAAIVCGAVFSATLP